LRAEVLGLEDRTDFNFCLLVVRVRATLQPLDRLVPRLDLPQPQTGDELLRLREGAVDDRALRTGESHTLAPGRRVQAVAREENPSLDQLLVIVAHFREEPLVGQDTTFGRLRCLHNHHYTHVICLLFAPASASR